MTRPEKLVPIAWPETPEWQAKERLELLRGTPFNVLVGKNLSPDLRTAAESAGLQVFDSSEIAQSPLIRLEPQGDKPVIVTGSLWPHVRGFNEGGGSGPTGNSWVDSNGWLIRLAQAKTPGSAVWLAHAPPAKNQLVTPEDYAIAIADARTWDGRWIVHLDDNLASRLASGDEKARTTWKMIADTTAWFEQNRPGPSMHPAARLGIVSDFRSPVFNDAVNLLARRQVPFLATTPDRLDLLPLKSLNVVCTTAEPLPPALNEFAQQGMVIRPFASPGETGKSSVTPRFVWSGANVAVAQARPTDPYLLATDIHLLMTRRQDLVRLFNGSACVASYLAGSDATASVEVVNYTGRKGSSEIALQVLAPFKQARIVRPDGEPAALPVRRTSAGSEVDLPKFGCYLRVDFS